MHLLVFRALAVVVSYDQQLKRGKMPMAFLIDVKQPSLAMRRALLFLYNLLLKKWDKKWSFYRTLIISKLT
ncbi:hypothetical protein ACVW2L_004140 [Mucilaginibacter sp. HD30]